MYNNLTIVIPAKDEEKNIENIISKCRHYSDDILVIDGHSTDATVRVALKSGARVEYDAGKGKGEALRRTPSLSNKEILVFIDADGSHDPGDIPKLVQPIIDGESDHVVGSRMRGGSDEATGDLEKFIRMIGSNIITLGINYRFGVRLTESQNGLRAIKKSVLASLNLKENITTIEQEMIIKSLRKGFRVTEVPTHEYVRQSGSSKVNVKKVWFRYVFSWLKYLFWG